MAKEGSTIGGLMDCFGTAVSMSLQYGVPLEVYVNKFSHTRFEPQGFTTNPDVRIAKSVVDYIFRWMGITFMAGYREANKLPPAAGSNPPGKGLGGDAETERRPAATKAGGPSSGLGTAAKTSSTSPNGSSAGFGSDAPRGANGHTGGSKPANGSAAAALVERPPLTDYNAIGSVSEQFALFQADAPTCDNCGSITVRNGNCYLCHVCGSSMGCS
jgi:ribonucleoside-diphosphate reductase alpha chain